MCAFWWDKNVLCMSKKQVKHIYHHSVAMGYRKNIQENSWTRQGNARAGLNPTRSGKSESLLEQSPNSADCCESSDMLTTWQKYKHSQKKVLPPKSDWFQTNKTVWIFCAFPLLKEWEEISVWITGTRKPVHCSHKKPDHDINMTWVSLEHPFQ